MKQDWNHKKLTDLCAIQYGFAFDSSYFNDSGDGLPLIRIRDVVRGFSETYYSGAYPPEYIVKKGDYLIGMDGEFNIAQWKGGEALLNQRVCKISSKSDSYIERFAYYFLCRILKEIEDETPFVTVKHLSAKRLNQILTPVPSIEEQKKICSLLDKMNRVIEAKKEQLKELDNLAQAIFYDMFGDPTINDKGWEKQKIGDCFSYIKNGANIKQDKSQRGLPITRIETLSNGVFNRDRMGYAGITDKTRYEQYILQDMDLLMSHINSKAYIGRTVLYRKKEGEVFIHGMNLLRLIPLPVLDSVFFCYLTKTDYVKEKIASIRKDAVNQSSFAISDLKKIDIPIPPIALQQAFAEKVEAIEQQKELINQSLREVQTLFDSRMDYWFSEENDDLGQLDKLG